MKQRWLYPAAVLSCALSACGPTSGSGGPSGQPSVTAPTSSAEGPSAPASARPSPSASASAAPSGSASASAKSLVVEPPPASAPREEREKAVRDLLSGRVRAGDLPLSDVSPGEEFEPLLRNAMSYPMDIRFESVKSTELDEAAVKKALEDGKMRFRLCYAGGLLKNPNLNGRLTARAVWKAAGEPPSTENTESDVPDAAVVSCVARALTKLPFPKPARLPASADITVRLLPG